MGQTYILVEWPESQEYMEEPWFQDEAFLADESRAGHSAYFIPLEKVLNGEEQQKNPLVCENCGSERIINKAWVDVNTDIPVEDATYDEEDRWCYNCENHTNLISKSEYVVFPVPQRAWINAPSSLNPYNKYHGMVGIAYTHNNGTTIIYFTEGSVFNMVIDPLYLETKNSQNNNLRL